MDVSERPDQVPRLLKFRAEHPDWNVYAEDMGWTWTAEHDGVIITASDLRDLLDKLEEQG